MDKYPVTAVGFARMEAELKQLKTVDRPAVIAQISEAREHGDLSENAEYHAARDKQSFLEGRIGELEAYISRAEVIDLATVDHTKIQFGATVTLLDMETDESKKYQIVGEPEADIRENRLSLSAPISRALMGRAVGDDVEVKTPSGTRYYEVEDIVYI
ncbi:MAG: transcription elongation factor GreA [Alphaproteobacteria bacterium]